MADIVSGLKNFEMPNIVGIGLNVANLGHVVAETRLKSQEVKNQQAMISAYADPEGPISNLRKNAPHLIPTYIKEQAGAQKAQAENVQQQLKLASDKVSMIGKTMSTVYDQDTWQKALSLLQANDAIPEGVNPPAFYDPKYVQQASQWATTSLEKITSHQKDVELGIQQQQANTAAQKLPIEQQMANTGSGQLALATQQYYAPPVAPLTQQQQIDIAGSVNADTGSKAALNTAIANIDRLTKEGSGLKNLTSPIGLGLSKLPLTKERDLATQIATIRDFYGTQGLQLIRGGRVSEPLIKTAENIYANLDPANGYESTMRSLKELKRISEIATGAIDEKKRVYQNIVNKPGGPVTTPTALPNTNLPTRAPEMPLQKKTNSKGTQTFTMEEVKQLARERGLKVDDVASTLLKYGHNIR